MEGVDGMKINPASKAIIQKVYGGNEPGQTREGGFAKILGQMINDTNSIQKNAAAAADAAVSGGNVEVHDVMIASEEAKLAFDLMLEVRNKLIDAYKELMQLRM
jgi:flagellar hook-basal body complex protein FliE